jgi:hypothetical protein
MKAMRDIGDKCRGFIRSNTYENNQLRLPACCLIYQHKIMPVIFIAFLFIFLDE